MDSENISLIPTAFSEEADLHIRKIQETMEPSTALLVCGNVNVFYCTGRFFRGYVWVPSEGNPVYFVIKPGIFSSADNMVYIRKPELIPEELARLGVEIPSSIGIEEDILSYSEALRLMKVFEGNRIFNSTPVLREARMVKTHY